jgi:hypothetical protein
MALREGLLSLLSSLSPRFGDPTACAVDQPLALLSSCFLTDDCTLILWEAPPPVVGGSVKLRPLAPPDPGTADVPGYLL